MSKKFAPQFIGIGAGYAGLAKVSAWLEAHPNIVDRVPAANFFNTDLFTKKGTSWYEDFLTRFHKDIQLCGDCSPSYLTSTVAPKRIVETYPDTKLFVILRHPIRRALAEYKALQDIDKVAREQSPAHYLATHPNLQIQGFYIDHLEAYLAYYSPLAMRFIYYEDLVANPLSVMQDLYDFVGVDKNFIPKDLIRYAPPEDEPKNPGLIKRNYHRLKKAYKKYKQSKVPDLFPADSTLDALISPDEWAVFTKAFLPATDRLSYVVGRDMSVFWGLRSED